MRGNDSLVARELGVAASYLSTLSRGKRPVPSKLAEKIELAFLRKQTKSLQNLNFPGSNFSSLDMGQFKPSPVS
jgi:hypothetical protein